MSIKIYQLAHRKIIQQNQNAVIQVSNQRVFWNVLSSPVYWFTMSAQTKLFLDRCFGLFAYKKNVFKGKRIAIAMSYGDADSFSSGCVNALRTFQDSFTYTGSRIVGMVHGSADKAGEIKTNKRLMGQAEKLGKELVAG